MAQKSAKKANSQVIELATFHVGSALCGLDILKIQEINKLFELTKVPQAPNYISGILNLRGQIVTVIDLGIKLGLSPTALSNSVRNIVVRSKGESIGLLVEKVGDIVKADKETIEPPPANINGVQGKFFTGVFKTPNRLIGVLDDETLLKEEL